MNHHADKVKDTVIPFFFSTDDLPERDRFDAWRQGFAHRVARVDVGVIDKKNFRVNLSNLLLPNLSLSKNSATACSLMRTRSLLRDGNDAFNFSICLNGQCDFRFGDGLARIYPGHATLFTSARLGGAISNTGISTLSVRINRDTASMLAPSMDKMLLQVIRPDAPALIIFRTYLEALLSSKEGCSSPMAALADDQLRELLAHILSPASDLARSAPYGGIKAARRAAVLQAIAAQVCDPHLNATAVGRRLGLSGRYVQQLMEGTGMTFSAYVRELRLENARKMLRDPLLAHKRIIDIYELAGFSDLSHFNRAFRMRYGYTPKDAR